MICRHVSVVSNLQWVTFDALAEREAPKEETSRREPDWEREREREREREKACIFV